MKLRIRWELFADQNLARLHVDVLLWDGDQQLFTEDELTDEQELLVESLDTIHGVELCEIHKYSIIVTKGAVFSWDEIMPRVESEFIGWCGTTMDVIDRQETIPHTEVWPDSEDYQGPSEDNIRDMYRRRRGNQDGQ